MMKNAILCIKGLALTKHICVKIFPRNHNIHDKLAKSDNLIKAYNPYDEYYTKD